MRNDVHAISYQCIILTFLLPIYTIIKYFSVTNLEFVSYQHYYIIGGIAYQNSRNINNNICKVSLQTMILVFVNSRMI